MNGVAYALFARFGYNGQPARPIVKDGESYVFVVRTLVALALRLAGKLGS